MKREVDMTSGPLTGKIIVYTIPIILSGVLQLLFNAVDMIVVGNFAGKAALAAVGSTSSLTNLLINLFIGVSVGANVLTAHCIGAKVEYETNRVVHTAIMTSIVSGVFLAVFGFFTVKPLLHLMGTPDEVLPLSTLYMRIYFAGMPVIMIYNFGSAILRAIGDTRSPLYYLTLAGVLNLLMNLFFVIVLHMSVAGVALATVLSQVVSAGLIIRYLVRIKGGCHLELQKLKIHGRVLVKMMRIGLPAGIQSCLFSFSNVLIQSSINLFGASAMAGSAAASSIEGFVYTSMNAFHQTTLNFTGQNAGAQKYDRIPQILGTCFLLVTLVGAAFGGVVYSMRYPLLRIYSSDMKVVEHGIARATIIILTYFLCGQMEVIVGALRGLGYAIMPMIVSLLGACVFRIVWIATVFQWHKSLTILYLSYPISWIVTTLVHCICFAIVFRKYRKKRIL